ncbi:hypothetical protein [Pseudonocardia nigra]|uniref:hypothetical protein n=1 Tax=Pseudonocardia nigra TaxID=1921578 RepID=UPI001C5DB608|nr:hypothetical protein [Pseudonocardia nigra]
MTTSSAPSRGQLVPVPVRRSILLWLAAIGAGVAETLVRFAMPDPPAPADLAVRFTIYATLTALVLALRTGRDAVRWVVAVLLGGVGTLSLVVEPLSWWTAGGSVPAFLGAADGPTLLAAGLRLFHVVAVLAALVLMFRPRANAFFRRG